MWYFIQVRGRIIEMKTEQIRCCKYCGEELEEDVVKFHGRLRDYCSEDHKRKQAIKLKRERRTNERI